MEQTKRISADLGIKYDYNEPAMSKRVLGQPGNLNLLEVLRHPNNLTLDHRISVSKTEDSQPRRSSPSLSRQTEVPNQTANQIGKCHDSGEGTAGSDEIVSDSIFDRIQFLERSICKVEKEIEARAHIRAIELQQPLLVENRRLKADLKEALYIAWCFQRELGLGHPDATFSPISSVAASARDPVHAATHAKGVISSGARPVTQPPTSSPTFSWPAPHPSPVVRDDIPRPLTTVSFDSLHSTTSPAEGLRGRKAGDAECVESAAQAVLMRRVRALEETNAALVDRVRQLESRLATGPYNETLSSTASLPYCSATSPGHSDPAHGPQGPDGAWADRGDTLVAGAAEWAAGPVRATVRLQDIVNWPP